MIIIKTTWVYSTFLKEYVATTIWPFIFTKYKVDKYDVTYNHEVIHGEQQKELLFIGFYLMYIWFWIKNGFKYGKDPFEAEAYANENNPYYRVSRKRNAWKNYK